MESYLHQSSVSLPASNPVWDFSTKLCDVLPPETGNYVISPLSIQLVMAMLYLGARDQTSNEIQKAFSFHSNEDYFLKSQKSLLQNLKSPAIRTANKIFIDKKFKIDQDYLRKTQSHLLSSSEGASLSEQPEYSRNIINKWVSDQTRGTITEALPPGSIQRDTRLILVNTLYFKGTWKITFPPNLTSKRPFFNGPSKTSQVPMMTLRDILKYHSSNDLKAQLLQLPYKEEGLSMLVILPFEKNGLQAVEKKLRSFSIDKALDDLEAQEVEVLLPKFKVESSFELEEPLGQLGVRTMFQKNANFSGISPTVGLYASKAIHKAFIEVNEEGTTASALTTIVFETLSLPSYPSFIASHPFIAIVMKDRTPIFFCRIKSL